MEITKEIIDTINDMLEDDVLSLDEDGRIVDYRDVNVDILSTEFCQEYKDNSLSFRVAKINFMVGNAEYLAVSKYTLIPFGWQGETNNHWEVEDCNARLAVGYDYLLAWDIIQGSWLVVGKMPHNPPMAPHGWVEVLIHTYVNSSLKVPDFLL